MNVKRLELFDYFFITRPILFIPGWATLLAGYAAGLGHQMIISQIKEGQWLIDWWHPQLAVVLTSFTAAMAASFIFNQLQDISSDQKNNKLFLFGNGFISKRAGYIEAWLLMAAALVLALLIHFRIFISVLMFIGITGYAYNFSPFRFKDKPLAGVFANMAMGWLAFVTGWLVVESASLQLVLSSLPYLFFNTALYFLTTLPDMHGDETAHKITFPIRYGKIFTIYISALCVALALLLSIWLRNEFMLIVSAFTMPFYMMLLFKQSIPWTLFTIKAGISIFALLISVQFPLLFLAMAALFFFTRFYYKHRFQFDYPNFKGQ